MKSHPGKRPSWPPTRRPDLPSNRSLPLSHRLGLASGSNEAAGEAARDPRLAAVEAALLAADEPLTPRRLATVAGLADTAEARRVIGQLRECYEQDGTAFQVVEVAGGYQLLTRPEYQPWLLRVRGASADLQLTPGLRETLTIVAYRQPITRADVEAIRGVGTTEPLRQLIEKGLIRISGRDNSLGRPVVYGTTKKFLQVFGLRSLQELPAVEALPAPVDLPPE